MAKKNYSAGLVSQGFWFHETKQYIELLNDGKSEKEIKLLSEEINIFGAVSPSRAKETFNGVRRRVNVLDRELQELFTKLNIDNQKILSLISILFLNDLFLEFMIEVFYVQLKKGTHEVTTREYKTFFSEKQRTNEIVANWKPYTYSRLSSAYRNYLLESGLLREDSGKDIITPKILDERVVRHLNAINRQDIVKSITGGI